MILAAIITLFAVLFLGLVIYTIQACRTWGEP